jgi:hypothetical protein
MQLFIDLLYAILLIMWGFYLIKYRRNVKSWTGNFAWAEKYIWSGGTYIIMILIGLFMIFLWVLYPFWWMEFITWRTAIDIPTQ